MSAIIAVPPHELMLSMLWFMPPQGDHLAACLDLLLSAPPHIMAQATGGSSRRVIPLLPVRLALQLGVANRRVALLVVEVRASQPGSQQQGNPPFSCMHAPTGSACVLWLLQALERWERQDLASLQVGMYMITWPPYRSR
jgi:hypothetical protein